MQPLCGDLDREENTSTTARQLQQDIKGAIMLLLCAYAKTESMFEDDEKVFDNLRMQLGTTLSQPI